MTSLDNPAVKQYIAETVGDRGMRLVDLLLQKKNATDSELAEALGEKPSHIRKILYNLYEARIAEYQKEKDKETGWLTFHWHITPGAAEHAIEQRRKREIGKLEETLRLERDHEWYICPDGHEKFDFDIASDSNFQCPEHHAMLEHHDNSPEIRQLEERLNLLRKASKA